jgi:protein-disulfide isomerase
MKFRGYIALTAALLAAGTAHGQSAPAAKDTQGFDTLYNRDTLLPAVLVWLQGQGSKLTLIGEEGGLKGYLVESPTGKMQSVYVTPDGKHVVAGVMFEKGGKNVTGVQIGEMRKRFDDAAKALGPNGSEASPVTNGAQTLPQNTNAVTDAKPAVDPVPAAAAKPSVAADKPADKAQLAPPAKADDKAAQDHKQDDGLSFDTPAAAEKTEAKPVVAPAAKADSAVAQAEVKAEPDLAIPEATQAVKGAKGNPSEVWASLVDKNKFLDLAGKTPFFEVGSKLAPATLWMVADPQCPYCHAAWDHIRPMIFDRRLKVRVILIDALRGSDPLAREVLASASPARRWLDSDAGEHFGTMQVDPSSKAFVEAGEFLDLNMKFAREFNIDRTPFMGYVGTDGRFYSVLGLPSELDEFLYATGVVKNAGN